MNYAIFLLLRRVRLPVILVILSHAIAVLGLTLIPSVDVNGQPAPPMDFFHAFYFITYTATTIGYTEPASGFSDGQRLWITGCIYLLVISWSFVLVTLVALFQDKGLQNALVANRFARRLKHLNEPFYLVCGYGETGSLICDTLDHLRQRFVVLEKDELRVQELELVEYRTEPIALAVDVRLPDKLLQGGLCHPRCRGILAVTNSEAANLAIVMAARLLNPTTPVLARARSAAIVANMTSFGADHIINPFERFAEYLSLAAIAPEQFRLVELLTGIPDGPLPEPHRPPKGHWIVCGFGVFGQAIVRNLRATDVTMTIVDPNGPTPEQEIIRGHGTDAFTLDAAGVREAAGIVAGSDDDVSNLAIAVTARELNPDIFVVTRQNRAANNALFEAFEGDFCMVPSQIVAQECLAILTTPMLARFLNSVRKQDEAWCARLAASLNAVCPNRIPDIWGIHLNAQGAIAAHRHLMLNGGIKLGTLLMSNQDHNKPLPIVPLRLERSGTPILLPGPEFDLVAGDHLLVAGPHGIRNHLELTLQNNNVLGYVLSGKASGGWLWKWLSHNHKEKEE
ncbi:ktn nad-binding domain involved with k+ transport [gamma proteobacterium HdN1]|nr:ktn nad-binding domain involved with k+ transport [gamma proteobacterium HdN1]